MTRYTFSSSSGIVHADHKLVLSIPEYTIDHGKGGYSVNVDPSRRFTSMHSGDRNYDDMMESEREDHLSEMTEDTNWDATDRDPGKPYDPSEDDEKMNYYLDMDTDEENEEGPHLDFSELVGMEGNDPED